jgi:GT2 family glycosyltransferase
MFNELRALARVASVRKQYRETPYFLEDHYLKQISAGKHWAAIVHFHDVGWRQKLNPSPFFDVAFYLAANEDVRQAGVNPLLHYIEYGWKEGRSPHPAFDPRAFLWAHPDIDPKHEDPAAECIRLYGTLSWRKASSEKRAQAPSSDKALVLGLSKDVQAVDRGSSAFERFKQQLLGLLSTSPPPRPREHPDPSSRADAAPVYRLHLDELRGNVISGWGWSSGSDDDGLRVELWCGSVRVGHVQRHIKRPDVDAHVGSSSGTKGFLLAGGSVAALGRLLGGESGGVEPTVRFGGEVQSLLTASPLVRDLASYRTLRAASAEHGWKVSDLWWANSRLLKLRMSLEAGEGGEPVATTLRVLQPLPQADGRLELTVVDELQLVGEQAVATVGVRNPLLPLLFVGRDEGGEMLFTDLLPFPSLLRGGLHEAEVSAVGERGGTLEDLCRLSDAYLAEAVGWGKEELASTVGEIEVDLVSATGAEAIFDPTVGSWLTSGFNIALRTGREEERVSRDLGDRSFVDYATAQLGRSQPRQGRGGRGRLFLPSRAIPTVGAVVSRRLPVGGGPRPGPYIVTDEAFPHRRYLVAFPGGMPASLSGGGPGQLGGVPRLAPLSGSEEASAGGDYLQPLAIAFQDLEPKEEALKVFPVPRDQAEIVAGPSCGPVSIIVPVLQATVDIGMLLGTVSSQETTAPIELILAVANCPGGRVDQLRGALEQALPGRGQIIDVQEALNTSEAFNRAASAASGEVLLFADHSVILHDQRTVETLGRIARWEGIGTAGCMHLKSRRAGDGVPTFASAGYFPARVDFAIAPHLGLSEQDCSEILPRALYPVVANSPHCFAVSAQAWRQAGGLSQHLPNSFAEVDLAIRLAEAGYVNVCTTLLSVFTDAPSGLKRFTDLQAPANFSLWRILPALKTSTLLRAF